MQNCLLGSVILNEVLVWSNQLSYSQKASRLLGTHTLPSFVLLQPWFMLLWAMMISKAFFNDHWSLKKKPFLDQFLEHAFPLTRSWNYFANWALSPLWKSFSIFYASKKNSTYIGLVVEKSIFVQIQPYNLFRRSLEFQQIIKRFSANGNSPDPWPSGSISHSKLIKQVSSRLVIFIGHFIGLRSSSFVQWKWWTSRSLNGTCA